MQAVNFGQVQQREKMHELSAFGHPDGNGACNSLIDWFETRESDALMELSIERVINTITYTYAGSHTIGGFIDRFNGLIYEHNKYVGAVLYPPDRQLRMFTMAISGETKSLTIMDIAFTQKWTLEYLQAQPRIKEAQLIPHNY